MQEEVESRSLTLAINTAKLTGRTLKNAIAKLLAYRKNKKAAKEMCIRDRNNSLSPFLAH